MRSERPGRPAQRHSAGVVGACVLSAFGHAALLGFALLLSSRPLPKPVDSYTVDLVGADAIGGNSGPIPGPLGAGLPSRPAAAAEPPPDSEPEVAEAEPEEVAEEERPAEEAKPVEPPAQELPSDDADAIALARATDVPPTATPRPMATATAVQVPTAAKPTPRPTAPAKPTPAAKATPTAKATRAVKPSPAPKATLAAKPTPRPAGASPTPRAAIAGAAVKPTLTVDQKIAEAVKRRAETSGGGDEASRKIAEAVKRRAEQVEGGAGGVPGAAEGGSGSTSVGPLGSGPGSGSGGAVRGIEYILYKRTMEERIREAWAWAGGDDSLECAVAFSVAADGQISAIRTVRSSGDPAYDNSAERAVRAVNPLRPIPDEYRNEFGDVELTFRARDRKQ